MAFSNHNENTENTSVSEHIDEQPEVTRLETREKIETEEESFEDCLKQDAAENTSDNTAIETEESFDNIEKNQVGEDRSLEEPSDEIDEESFDDIGRTDSDFEQDEKSDVEDFDIGKADIKKPDTEMSDVEKPDIEKPDIEESDVEKSDVEHHQNESAGYDENMKEAEEADTEASEETDSAAVQDNPAVSIEDSGDIREIDDQLEDEDKLTEIKQQAEKDDFPDLSIEDEEIVDSGKSESVDASDEHEGNEEQDGIEESEESKQAFEEIEDADTSFENQSALYQESVENTDAYNEERIPAFETIEESAEAQTEETASDVVSGNEAGDTEKEGVSVIDSEQEISEEERTEEAAEIGQEMTDDGEYLDQAASENPEENVEVNQDAAINEETTEELEAFRASEEQGEETSCIESKTEEKEQAEDSNNSDSYNQEEGTDIITEDTAENTPKETDKGLSEDGSEDVTEDNSEDDSDNDGARHIIVETEDAAEPEDETNIADISDKDFREQETQKSPAPEFAAINEAVETTKEEKDLVSETNSGGQENTEKSVEQKIEEVHDVEGVSLSYLTDLRDESAMELFEEQQQYEAQTKQAVEFYTEMTDEKTSPERRAELYEEYQALRETIGNTRDRIESIKAGNMTVSEKLESTRQELIVDGREASNNTGLEAGLSQSLHEEYNELYYDDNASADDLADLSSRNQNLIQNMTADRDRIERAKEAKMSQIRDYVCSNDMERYDTERDPVYRQMIAEYRELEEAGHKLDYPIASLDEDTKLISERIGQQYESVQKTERIYPSVAECRHGTDDPEKTNYHADEVKAEKVLEPFADQTRWEEMGIREKQTALDSLRDYAAEIFGDADKPEIVYYDGPDDSYGSYIPSANAIKVNIRNLEDASEAMDTIAHEYRHRYQYMRAASLENTRDVDFRRGLDPQNYIEYDPDKGLNDFEGYKNQLVEADARAFAQTFKKKLAEIQDNCSANDTKTESPQLSVRTGVAFKQSEQDFEEQSLDENTAEDFSLGPEVGKMEIGNNPEELTPEEISLIKSQVESRYRNCSEIAARVKTLENYKEHTGLENGHIEKVYQKSMEAADTLSQIFREYDYGGYYTTEIDRRTLGAMAWYHDTGMDGAIDADDYESGKTAYIQNRIEAETEFRKQQNGEGQVPPWSLDPDLIREELETRYDAHFRKDHQFYSAIHALEDREALSSLGINADEVAFGCMLHSKSGSGVRELSSTEQWDRAIDALYERIVEYNAAHESPITFDPSFMRTKADGEDVYGYEEDVAARVRTECACLRLGDANGHDYQSETTQSGHILDAEMQSDYLQQNPDSGLMEQISDSHHYYSTKLKAEVLESSVQNDGTEIDTEDAMGRVYSLGEKNFQEIGTRADQGKLVEYVKLVEGDHYPNSTQQCILERIKEAQSITAPCNPNLQESPSADYTEESQERISPIGHMVEIDLGDVRNQETIESYRRFRQRVYRQYRVQVKVKYNDCTGEK